MISYDARLHDECASCKADVFIKPTSITFHTDSFCATCRIANALEEMIAIMETRE